MRPIARWVVAVWLLLLPLAGCSTGQATTPSGQSERELTVRRATFQDRVLLTGELEAVNSEKIRVPRTPTWRLPIRWLEVDGTVVEEGQKILELDNSQFSGELGQKRLAEIRAYNDLLGKKAEVKGELSDAEFRLEQQRILLEKARLEAEVPAELRPRREYQEKQLELARAESGYDKALEDHETAQKAADAALEELRIALDRARDEIRTAEEAIEALTLRAPRGGILVVSESRDEGRKFQVGDSVWVGLIVARIPDLAKMKVVAQLSDVDDGRVTVGMRTSCSLDTYPDREFTGHITEIAPIAQEANRNSSRRSFRVEILLDESDPEMMRPGMSVKVEVLPREIEDVLVAPRQALELGDDEPKLVLGDGSRREVKLGPCNASECVIEEGATEGARLGVRG